ncbi:MAG: DUF167 domain-containing protein [Limnobacter sp.]|nr:DUF167 domain-containing protein [Limnobacter sp.]
MRSAATQVPELPDWLAGSPGHWRLRLAVQPGAQRTLVVGIHDGCLKLRVAAPPVDGRANDEILRWLSKLLAVPRAQLRIVAGESSRRKSVAIDDALDAATLVQALSPPGAGWSR